MKKYLEYLCFILLSANIILLCVILMLNMKTTNNNGRYQVAGNSSNSCWVIDTETGNLVFKSSILRTERRWLRAGYHNFPRLSKLGDFDYE